MTTEDIIRMAREAGLIKDWMVLRNEESDALARFASLIAAAEREACAKLAASKASVGVASNYPTYIAAAIRARSQT